MGQIYSSMEIKCRDIDKMFSFLLYICRIISFTMKKLIFILALLVGLTAKAAELEIDGIYYNLLTKNKTVTSCEVIAGKKAYSGEITIPNSITYKGKVVPVVGIADRAFYQCPGLQTVVVGDKVSTIGIEAFCQCSSLKSITLGVSVTQIKKGAFKKCKSLETVELSDYLTGIGPMAFYECSKLKTVTIGEGVKYIGLFVFEGCDALTDINVKPQTPPQACPFPNYSATLHVKADSKQLYNAELVWSNFTKVEDDL